MTNEDFTPELPQDQHNPNLQAIEEIISVATDHTQHVVRLSAALSSAAFEPQAHLTATRIAQASYDAGLCELFAIDRQAIVDLLTWQGVSDE